MEVYSKKKAIILKKDKIKITFYGGEMGDPSIPDS
jgi:hypothetical protein